MAEQQNKQPLEAEYTVKNIGKGARFFHAVGGTKTLEAGQSTTRPVRFTEGQLAAIRSNGEFFVEDYAPKTDQGDEADEFDGMDDDGLRAYLTDRDGTSPPYNAKRSTLLAKARA